MVLGRGDECDAILVFDRYNRYISNGLLKPVNEPECGRATASQWHGDKTVNTYSVILYTNWGVVDVFVHKEWQIDCYTPII